MRTLASGSLLSPFYKDTRVVILSEARANVNTTSSNSFSPNTATITHGQTVCWQNSSSVAHTVTDNGGAFDTSLPVGQVFLHTYPTAGTYTYHCKLHAGMTGSITVN